MRAVSYEASCHTSSHAAVGDSRAAHVSARKTAVANIAASDVHNIAASVDGGAGTAGTHVRCSVALLSVIIITIDSCRQTEKCYEGKEKFLHGIALLFVSGANIGISFII